MICRYLSAVIALVFAMAVAPPGAASPQKEATEQRTNELAVTFLKCVEALEEQPPGPVYVCLKHMTADVKSLTDDILAIDDVQRRAERLLSIYGYAYGIVQLADGFVEEGRATLVEVDLVYYSENAHYYLRHWDCTVAAPKAWHFKMAALGAREGLAYLGFSEKPGQPSFPHCREN